MTSPEERAALHRVQAIEDAVVAAVQAGDDLGDVLSLALGQAADRLGGYEALVAGRPGSWEADLVRRLAHQYAADGLRAGRPLY